LGRNCGTLGAAILEAKPPYEDFVLRQNVCTSPEQLPSCLGEVDDPASRFLAHEEPHPQLPLKRLDRAGH
jgi:hypothetical protein